MDDDLCMVTTPHKTRGNGKIQKRPFIVNTVEQGDAILISGCSDKQTSADAYINGRYHGALTFYLAQTLRESNWNISYEDLVTKVNDKLDREQYKQDPQLESKKEYVKNLFLGGTNR